MARAATRKRKSTPTSRLSEQMREVLLWVYNYERPELENEPGATPTRNAAGEIVSITVSFSLDRQAANLVPWQTSVFLGKSPTQSQRNALSKTLKRLEERGLIYRYSVVYKDDVAVEITQHRGASDRIRTTHLQLSAAGSLLAESLRGEIDLEEHESGKKRHKLEARAAGLEFALLLLQRERLQHVDNETAARRLSEIAERLSSLTEEELKHEAGGAFLAVNESLRELKTRLNHGE